MARPRKQTVDYFPHMCSHGKTIYILEQKYGNDGYAFWFKLLEMLGSADGHYLKLDNDADWEFLQAKTHLSGDICVEILDLLARLGAIDPELWEQRIVWSDNFVENVSEAYRKRASEIPAKPSFRRNKPAETRKKSSGPDESPGEFRNTGVKNPHTILDYTKQDPPLQSPPENDAGNPPEENNQHRQQPDSKMPKDKPENQKPTEDNADPPHEADDSCTAVDSDLAVAAECFAKHFVQCYPRDYNFFAEKLEVMELPVVLDAIEETARKHQESSLRDPGAYCRRILDTRVQTGILTAADLDKHKRKQTKARDKPEMDPQQYIRLQNARKRIERRKQQEKERLKQQEAAGNG